MDRPIFYPRPFGLLVALLVVALDGLAGKIATRGWTHVSEVPDKDLAARLQPEGVKEVICTDIERDGMRRG